MPVFPFIQETLTIIFGTMLFCLEHALNFWSFVMYTLLYGEVRMHLQLVGKQIRVIFHCLSVKKAGSKIQAPET